MLHRFALHTGVLLLALLSPISFGQADNQALPADVRLVIDISGSMKVNDPNNLREPAVELLVQLLPEKSLSGIWTFGRQVNMLVKHQAVDEAWRKAANAKASEINSVGLFTNIGEALERAAYDNKPKPEQYRSSIILLTDGMVDIDKDPAANKKEWRRIVDEVLPGLKAAGYTIHTIALSDNADTNLLNKLSLSTDGIAEVAKTADDLMRIFLKAFSVAVPAEQVPINDEGFAIDSSVEEFTALIFKKAGSAPTQLIAPDKESFTAQTRSRYLNWYAEKNYDLITVKQPLEGQWTVVADMQPDSRVTVVSNLNLSVRPLPNNVFRGQVESLTFSLQEDGKTVVDPRFLELMEASASLAAGRDEFDLRPIWQEKADKAAPPADGKFKMSLPAFDKDGIYQLSIVLDGKSFVREFTHQFTTRDPFGAEIKQVFNEGKLEYQLTAKAYVSDIVVEKTQVVATIFYPDGRKIIRPLPATELDTWQSSIRPEMEGDYEAVIRARGEDKDKQNFDIHIPPLKFSYAIDAGFVAKKESFFEESPSPSPSPTPSPTPEAASPEATPAPTAASEAEGMPTWALYTLLGLANILIFGLGYLAFKKIIGGEKDDLSEPEAETKTSEPVAETAMDPMDDVDDSEDEPPMEDIDPDDEEVAPPPKKSPPKKPPEPEPEEELESMPMDDDMVTAAEMYDEPDIDEGAEPEPEPEPEEEEPEPDMTIQEDPMDALDDLDQMAIDAEEKAEETAMEEEDDEDEEEDMVAAMLKAQGLDLAEDELDDAISSLIDELENDDSLNDFEEDDDKR